MVRSASFLPARYRLYWARGSSFVADQAMIVVVVVGVVVVGTRTQSRSIT